MKLRKANIDNSVIYDRKDDHSHRKQNPLALQERDRKPNTRKKKASNNKKVSQNIQTFTNIFTGEGFRINKD